MVHHADSSDFFAPWLLLLFFCYSLVYHTHGHYATVSIFIVVEAAAAVVHDESCCHGGCGWASGFGMVDGS